MDKLHSRENKHTPGPEEEKGFISITLAFSAFLQARHRGKAAEGLIRTRPRRAPSWWDPAQPGGLGSPGGKGWSVGMQLLSAQDGVCFHCDR